MTTIEGREGRAWIDEYVQKAGKQKGVVKGLRALVKKAIAGCEEYVNPWKIPSFDSNGTVCGFMTGKEHVTFIFLRRAAQENKRHMFLPRHQTAHRPVRVKRRNLPRIPILLTPRARLLYQRTQ